MGLAWSQDANAPRPLVRRRLRISKDVDSFTVVPNLKMSIFPGLQLYPCCLLRCEDST